MRKGLAAVTLLVCAAAVASCGGSDPEESSIESLRERVTAYWEARSVGDLEGAHAYYEPDFREHYDPAEFASAFARLNRFAPRFQGIESVEADESEDRAKVGVQLAASVSAEGIEGYRLDSTVDETWVLVDDAWWHAGEALAPSP